MLSALAKYIFGGVMGDAPETTTMQYETREINDWLLVDMPDQDIDNEDMNSESDDDDILTAVPLLLAEEVPMSPRQIVLSYEPDSSCDKSYTKIRKGFQDKIHAASPKVQVHTSDKIQGNFVANAISLENGDISNDKLQHNLSEVRENVKSKQFKSKISKPKKSKKNKINKKCISKMQDTHCIIKRKYNDDVQDKINNDVQERSRDNVELNLREEIQCVLNEIQNNLGAENQYKLEDKIGENSHIAIIDNSSDKNTDNVEKDSHTAIAKNSSHKNAGKVEKGNDIAIIDNANHTNAENIQEDSHNITIIDNSNHTNQNTSYSFHKNCASNIQENAINKVPNSSYKPQPNNTIVESNLSNISKRSYADVVKAKIDTFDKDCNKELLVDNILCQTETESAEISHHDKAQNDQLEYNDSNRKPKGKKNKSKKISKNNVEKKADIQSQDIPVSICVNNKDETQGNVGDKKDMLDKTAIIPPQVQGSFNDEIKDSFNGKNVSDINAGKINIGTLDTCLITYENDDEDVLKNNTVAALEDTDDKSKSKMSLVQQNFETTQDSFADKNETVLINASENFESRLQDMSDDPQTEGIFVKNVKYNNVDFQNDSMLHDFIDDIYLDLSLNSDSENLTNLTDNCQNFSMKVTDNQDEIQNSLKFQQNLDDRVLKNIADLWDIYTKIQDNSDDDINEISDDEMNENSQDEYEEISDDEMYRRPCGKNLQNLFGEEDTKLYNTVFEYNPDEESEESDSEVFINSLLLPINNSIERKPEFLQSFKFNFLEELKQNVSEIPKHHSSCVPLTEYELVEYFNFEPQYFYACQSLQYPSSYALAIAEYYSNHDQYFPKYPERCNAFIQKCKRRAVAENQTSPAPIEPRIITNTAEILEKIINEKCSVLPTKTAVVLEHVKDLKPIQQAMQYEARKCLTRSQLNRQNRNYIYQASSKTNRRRNLQRNHSGVNNNRKCC